MRSPSPNVRTTAAAASSDTYDVVISGASFAGLALARGLSDALSGDVRIAIVDVAPAPPPLTNTQRIVATDTGDGRAFAIWAGAKAVLQGLGVWHDIAPTAQPITSIELTDSALDDVMRSPRLTYATDVDTVSGEVLPVAHMVSADALLRALYASVINDAAITLLTPARAESLELFDNEARLTLADGAILSCALCVSAEGRNSGLRDRAGIKTVGWNYDQTGIVATVALEKPHNGVAIQHFLPGGPFAVLPLRENRACITWSAASDEAQRVLALDDLDFKQELEKRIGGRFGAITLVGKRRAWPLGLKVARDLTAKRFALIGDAAHGVHPIAGQGVNLAMRDVAALVEVVVQSIRIGFDAGHQNALDHYARWRRFDATTSAAAFDGINRVFSVDNAVLRAGRGACMGVLDGLPQAKRWMFEEASGITGELPKLVRGEAV